MTADGHSRHKPDLEESDDLSKPTAPSRPSRLPALMPVGVPIVVAVALTFGLVAAIVLIQRTKASRMAVAAATAVPKMRSGPSRDAAGSQLLL
jgi:hypothetical protein